MSEKYTLEELYRKGQISYKPIVYRDIKQKVIALKASGMKNAAAVRYVAAELGWTTRGIYQAIKKSL